MDLYQPRQATIEAIVRETPDVKTFHFRVDGEFCYAPGQFFELSIPGAGEAPFSISSAPTGEPVFQSTIRRAGLVTRELHRLLPGATVGVRGPFGRPFPIEQLRGKGLIFIGGGIGFAPLRAPLQYALAHRQDFGPLLVVNGARSVADVLFVEQARAWQQEKEVQVVLTVDPGGEAPGWSGRVGLIPKVVEEMHPSPANAAVLVCGPPIMIKFTLQTLDRLGFTDEQVLTTLEMRMKCGLGKCGRCNIGPIYVCKDGPVFSMQEVKAFVGDF
ncbi:MAG: FAD/NAD(P)-binding protein [Thermodesulfobacteriota bacterium]